MGQAASQPDRVNDVEEPRSIGRAAAAFRRVVPERRRQEQEYEHDGLLTTDEQPGGHSGARPLRRTGRGSLNRLSQIINWNDDDRTDAGAAGSHAVAESPRGALLHRTRSRLHDMLRRDASDNSFSLRSSLRARRQTSYRHADSIGPRDEAMPRLPSIDLPAALDDGTLGPLPPSSSSSASHHQRSTDPEMTRSNSPLRRTSTRFSALRRDGLSSPFHTFTSSLRRRRSPIGPNWSIRPRGNEDQAMMLSHLLSLAAMATARTLMADHPESMTDTRSLIGGTGLGNLASGGEDGTFEGFLTALENGRIASALRRGTNDHDTDNDGAPAPPLNFFRMFRFGSPAPAPAPRQSPGSFDPNESEDRLVPIIIVGIRSIPQGSSNTSGGHDELPPFIDALGNLPNSLPANLPDPHAFDALDAFLRPPQNGTAFRHRRRASMGGLGMSRNRFSDRMDDQRDHRSPDRRRDRPWSVSSSSSFGPRPSPLTRSSSPAPELGNPPSRNSTPGQSRSNSLLANSSRDTGSNESGRTSLLNRSSAASPLSSHTEETASLHSTHSSTNLLGADLDPIRAHRRSDTAPNIHYPRFASGHPRRNGVVEPDHHHLPPLSRSASSSGSARAESSPRDSNSSSGAGVGGSGNDSANASGTARNGDARSWIIYVLGGSYPENHPILTTPSLFTENPTYEDMMLLSALIGPAKAPVATDEDVQNAGGIYNIVELNTHLVAHAYLTPTAPGNTTSSGGSSSEDSANMVTLVAIAANSLAPSSSATSTSQDATAAAAPERIYLEPGQRCLVCLCDFESNETGRKLAKCNHFFHRECIDQWLTTGRNSCPLCREQGVNEKKSANATASTTEVAPEEDADAINIAPPRTQLETQTAGNVGNPTAVA